MKDIFNTVVVSDRSVRLQDDKENGERHKHIYSNPTGEEDRNGKQPQSTGKATFFLFVGLRYAWANFKVRRSKKKK